GPPRPGLVKPVLQAPLRPPAQLVHGAADVEDAPLELTWARRRELGLDILLARNPPAELEQLDDRGLTPGADVEDAALVPGRGERRAHDIARVDVVARLLPVAEDLR